MLSNSLLELYGSVLNSITICYIIYRLNTDQKKVPLSSFFFSGLVMASIIALVNILVPELILPIKVVVFILTTVFSMMIFFKYKFYYCAITGVFSVLLMGFGEVLVTMLYAYPLRMDAHAYRSSYFHISIGGLLLFAFSFIMLILLADNFIKARRRIYKKHRKFTVLLCGNLITVFVLLLFVFCMYKYSFQLQTLGSMDNVVYFSLAVIVAVLFASIVGTIYLINYFLLNRLKYDRLKMNNIKDVMTDTLNRGSGLKFIEEQLEICKKSKRIMTICYIDVNDLKVINDMLGHREGDYLIKTIVSAIKDNIRESDVISRLGGDEFVVVFPGCHMDYAEKVMDRISLKLRLLKPFADKEYTISISYGFSQFDGEMEITVEGLLDKADHQMYMNKRAMKAMA